MDAQIGPKAHSQLRAALDRDDSSGAEQILRTMMKQSPGSFTRNNYDYLLGRLLRNRRANAEAMSLFEQVILRKSPLAGYALIHQAEIARASDNPNEEQRLLKKFISQHRDHLRLESAIRRLSVSYFKTERYHDVIDLLRPANGTSRYALAVIGDAQSALGQTESARLSFEAVISSGSMDDATLHAVRGLDLIATKTATPLTETERLRRARVYQFNRAFAEARTHWLAVIRDFPQSSRRPEALFQIGRGYYQEENYQDALKWYEQAHTEFPMSREGEEGFYFAGHCYQNLDLTDRAIARYEDFLKAYSRSDYYGYAHLNAVDTLRSAGRLSEALQWVSRAKMIANEPFIVTTAIFYQSKIHLTQENYRAALANLNLLKSRNAGVRGLSAATSAVEVTYLRAYCLEKLGHFEEAIIEYLSLPELRNGVGGYYGRRASGRLRALASNARAGNMVAARRDRFLAEARSAHTQDNAAAAKAAANQALRFPLSLATRTEMLKILELTYAKLRGYQLPTYTPALVERSAPIEAEAPPGNLANGASHQTIAGELLFLGLSDEGAPELAESAAGPQTVIFYCAKGDCAHRSLKYSEPILNSLPEDYRLELLPREWAEVFYPMPYREELIRHAASRSVDPRFVLSIIRQESRYDPKVKSRAAARGMLQFISSTASRIAEQLKIGDFDQNDLYDPETAIVFGSQYMQNLFSEFGSPQAVAAAYNGSEGSVRRWRARARSVEPDRLVIEVLKRETKEYVFRVMNFYDAYTQIYPNLSQYPNSKEQVGGASNARP
ncbi:MAG: transglycosylase SLT domain-containing protein [Acidobacteria bacterium]|nr:transglycosylase SLT domain-containing protein [Acidobacteriota bacterium]